jgi:hypothetical protein
VIKKYVFGICLALLSSWSLAQSCNRTSEDDGDYVQPWEFCDDDIKGRKIPNFGEYPADTADVLKPMLPKSFDGWDAEDSAGWMEAIQNAYKSGKRRFAGHYLFVRRGACGQGCHRAIIVDLKDGKVHVPNEIKMVLANVNPLPETMCKSLDVDCNDSILFTYRADSKLLLVIGQLDDESKKRGLYYFQWDENKLKLVSKVEKSPNEKRKKRSKSK